MYYTPKEAADKIKVTRRTIYRWIKAGELKAEKPVKGSRLLRIKAEELCRLQAH